MLRLRPDLLDKTWCGDWRLEVGHGAICLTASRPTGQERIWTGPDWAGPACHRDAKQLPRDRGEDGSRPRAQSPMQTDKAAWSGQRGVRSVLDHISSLSCYRSLWPCPRMLLAKGWSSDPARGLRCLSIVNAQRRPAPAPVQYSTADVEPNLTVRRLRHLHLLPQSLLDCVCRVVVVAGCCLGDSCQSAIASAALGAKVF